MVEDIATLSFKYSKIAGNKIHNRIPIAAGFQRNHSRGRKLKQLDFHKFHLYPFGLCIQINRR